jgi:RNA polymerase sigma-70 factor (family 1)
MKEGNADAFEQIYERYWEKLYAGAVKRVRSEAEAKDLVQDLFITLWSKRDTIVIQKSLAAYLFTSIRHRVLNYVKSNIVKGDYIEALSRVSDQFDNSADLKVISEDLEWFIDQRINDLSPRVKEVFLLSRNENLSVKEIAEKLNVSDQTVKNQLTKAVRDLRLFISGGSTALSFYFFLLSRF